MIQRRRGLKTGAGLLLFVISNSIPGEAAVRQKTTISTIGPATIMESDQRYEKLPDVKFETQEDQYTTYFTTNGMILAGFTSHEGTEFY